MSSKRRKDLKIRLSEAKYLEEPDFDVQKHLASPKSGEINEKPISETEYFSDKNFWRQKIESCKSSETCVAEVSRRPERWSRGKRPFEVRKTARGHELSSSTDR